MVCILVVRVSREILPVGYLKGLYKSESSLMTCVAELHGSVTRMPSSILSDIGIVEIFANQGVAPAVPNRLLTFEIGRA